MTVKHNFCKRTAIAALAIIVISSLLFCACAADKNPYGISAVEEFATGEELKKWPENFVAMAEALFNDFEICSVKIDGEWKRGLYNEENGLLVTQDGSGETYTVYHGGEAITVPMGRKFPDENYVGIELVDVTGDGGKELYIWGSSDHGAVRNHIIGIVPFLLMTDAYDVGSVSEIVPEYRIASVSATEEGAAEVQAEFVLKNGAKYMINMTVDDADMDLLDKYTLIPVMCNTVVEDRDENGFKMAFDIRFRAEQGAPGRKGVVYVFLRIGLEYDAVSGHFIPGNDVQLEYKDIEPADWG